jgi:hypothetical protein
LKKNDLDKKTVAELKALAKSKGLTGYVGLAKAKLIQMLLGGASPGSKPGVERKHLASAAASKPAPRRAKRAPSPAPATAKRPARAAPAKKVEQARAPEKKVERARLAAPAKRTKPAPTRRRAAKRPAEPSHAEARLLSPRATRAFSLLRATGEQRVQAGKYYLGVPESPELDAHFEYPESYGESGITLMVRDPYWLFTYWEFAPDLQSTLRARIGAEALAKSRLVLRVYDVTGTDPDHPVGYHDIDVAPGARNWYVNVMRVERDYCVDLGIITPDGSFIVIARSNRVSLPPVGPSGVVDEEWVTLEALEEFYAKSERGPSSGSGGWGSGGFGR